jgi:hypothetical protein
MPVLPGRSNVCSDGDPDPHQSDKLNPDPDPEPHYFADNKS